MYICTYVCDIPRVIFYKAEKLIELARLLHQCRPDAKGVSTD
jgi:hypothetical protein